MLHITKENNFTYLAVGLVLMLFVGALLEHIPGDAGPRIIQGITVAALLIGAWGIKGSRSRFVTNIVFVLVMLLVIAGGELLDRTGFSYAHLLLLLCFFIWMTWIVARQVLFTGGITSNDIVGAICIYVMLALIWAIL